ncbi:GNAT family N-acetyltransferase [Shimazuella sp. AN120528]|uniref:GNAT family N-acetyltransferase n=1 Tax=Shimazuella soli TaxID=1892854 RepID=UPI001F102D3B|nr:GNAT family N-acetyltransferase [Shimazuella soli]MCH5583980.1 GNAT family N-acetyltransferase [Shimazuella soli]
MLTIRHIKPSDTYHLRHTILRPNQSIEDCMYKGDEDDSTIHLGAFWEGKLISIGTFMQVSHPDLGGDFPYQLRGMATDPNYRRQKAGSTLMAHAESLLKENNCDLLWCNARYNVKDYYAHMGFQEHGDIFEIEPIGLHVVMFKNLD